MCKWSGDKGIGSGDIGSLTYFLLVLLVLHLGGTIIKASECKMVTFGHVNEVFKNELVKIMEAVIRYRLYGP